MKNFNVFMSSVPRQKTTGEESAGSRQGAGKGGRRSTPLIEIIEPSCNAISSRNIPQALLWKRARPDLQATASAADLFDSKLEDFQFSGFSGISWISIDFHRISIAFLGFSKISGGGRPQRSASCGDELRLPHRPPNH